MPMLLGIEPVKVLAQHALKLFLEPVRTDDLDVRYPIPHDGQHLIWMPDLRRDNEAERLGRYF